MKVGVVIPSRLAPRPCGLTVAGVPELWIDGALASVFSQVGYDADDWTVYVGLSPGTPCPDHVRFEAHVIWADGPGQAAAVNAAAEVACLSSDVLLFLEDDDRWAPRKFEHQVAMLDIYPFVSCSQDLVTTAGSRVGVNDYPVPSTWAMRADVWSRVGLFNTSYKWMVDAEWLGRLSDKKVRRCHIFDGGQVGVDRLRKIGFLQRSAELVKIGEAPLVLRTANPEGGMATIEKDFLAGREADVEAQLLRERFGCDPW